MLPTFATVNVTVPAVMVCSESSTFHSDSLALTAARSSGAGCMGAPASATAASSSPAAFRPGTHVRTTYVIFLRREWDSSFLRSQRPLALRVYSAGNNPVARGVSCRRPTRHLEVGRLQPSEQARFEAVVLPHLDAAYALARYLTRNAQDAEDVVQDACLRAIKYFEGFRGETAPSARAWLLTIVRNTAHTWHTHHRPDALATEFDETRHSDAATDDRPD